MTAVRGNNDHAWTDLPAEVVLRFEALVVYVVHDVNDLRGRTLPDEVRVVVSGHSHQPSIVERGGVLYVNPGSAGPRRFRLPIAAAELVVRGDVASARTVELTREAGGVTPRSGTQH